MFLTFLLAAIFSIISTALLGQVTWAIGVFIVLLFVLVGILFDVVGLAAAAANEIPFHSMAAERVVGAKQAIRIVRNADRFSNFCNDVIGDISGVISGTASAYVVIRFVAQLGQDDTSLFYKTATVVFAALVSALTVSGKAMGKSFALHYSTPIILSVGKILYFLEKKLGFKLFVNQKQGKRGKKRAVKSN